MLICSLNIRETVAKSSPTWRYSHTTFVQVSLTYRHEICGEFTMRKTSLHSHECRTTVLGKHANNSWLSGENRILIDIRANVVRHSLKCLATVARVKLKLSDICENVVRNSFECHASVIVVRHNCKIRPKLENLYHKCLFNETATWMLRFYRLSLSRDNHEIVSFQ